MALVVENGTGVAGANSYLSVAELRAFAVDRGLSLPADDLAVVPLLVKSADYLELFSYIGTKLSDGQGLSFPRDTLDLFGQTVHLGVPAEIKKAQCMLAVEAQNGELSASARPSKYVRTKIDSIDVTYNSAAKMATGMQYPAVNTLISPFLTAASNGSLLTVRA